MVFHGALNTGMTFYVDNYINIYGYACALSCMKYMIEFNRVMYLCMKACSLHCHVHLESTLCDVCMVSHTSPQVHGVTACM